MSSGIPFSFHSPTPTAWQQTAVEQPVIILHKHTSRAFVFLACGISAIMNFTIFLWHRKAFLQLPFKSEVPSFTQFILWPSQTFHSHAFPSLIFPGWCGIPTLPSTTYSCRSALPVLGWGGAGASAVLQTATPGLV